MKRRKFLLNLGTVFFSVPFLAHTGRTMAAEADAFGNATAIGIGGAGINILNKLTDELLGIGRLAIEADDARHATTSSIETLHLPMENVRREERHMQVAKAAECTRTNIRDRFAGLDRVFIIAGLGGAAGTCATPFIARAAKEAGVQVIVGLWIHPFSWEGKRPETALAHLPHLRQTVDLSLDFRLGDFAKSDEATMPTILSACDGAILQAIGKLRHA
jgi:cell division protein FtsZ